jgi:hypothetical protein
MEYSRVEKKSSPIDGQFDALPMLIDGVGASSADGAVPRFISAREAKKSSDETKQRALLEARLEQEQLLKIRSTEGKELLAQV